MFCCFFGVTMMETYHCDRVDWVHDGEQQDVVLGKVPIVSYRQSVSSKPCVNSYSNLVPF